MTLQLVASEPLILDDECRSSNLAWWLNIVIPDLVVSVCQMHQNSYATRSAVAPSSFLQISNTLFATILCWYAAFCSNYGRLFSFTNIIPITRHMVRITSNNTFHG
jgi:hypothetical protein